MKKTIFKIFLAITLVLLQTSAYCITTNSLLKTTSTWDKDEYKSLKMKHPEVNVLNIKIDVGEKLLMHKHDLINIVYVEKGTLTVITDKNQEITVKKGECFPELIGKYHYGLNAGKEPVELIVFYIGEKGTPLSVLKDKEK